VVVISERGDSDYRSADAARLQEKLGLGQKQVVVEVWKVQEAAIG